MQILIPLNSDTLETCLWSCRFCFPIRVCTCSVHIPSLISQQAKKTDSSEVSAVIPSPDCLPLQIKSSSTVDNGCLSAVSLCFSVKTTPTAFDIITVYGSLLPNVRCFPGGRPPNLWQHIKWGAALGPTVRSILGLLINTGPSRLLLDPSWMCSACCRWRLQWTKHRSPPPHQPPSHFKLCISAPPSCVCVLSCYYFIHFSFLELFSPCRSTSEAPRPAVAFTRSRWAITFPAITTLFPPHLHVSLALTLSLLPIHISSHIDHLSYRSASFLP